MLHLICLGNPLHADDGFGAAVGHRLAHMHWPGHIRIYNTARRRALPLFDGCDKAVVLTSFGPSCGRAGQILRLAGHEHPIDFRSPFGGGTITLLSTVSKAIRPTPEVEVLGPVAGCAHLFSPGLSPLVAAAVESVTALLAREFGGCRSRQH